MLQKILRPSWQLLNVSSKTFSSKCPLVPHNSRKLVCCSSDLVVRSYLTYEKADIKDNLRHCEARIGFLGGTGTGKSSVLNALLGMEIPPKSLQSSSTAVPVEVAYNHNDDPSHAFRAIIEGISRSEFLREIEDLSENKRRYDAFFNENEQADKVIKDDIAMDSDFDNEMYQSMLQSFEKIKCLYPNLQNLDDLHKTTAKKLLNEDHIKKTLDAKIMIDETEESVFAKLIMPYIEAKKGKKGNEALSSLWPLVKVAKIYVKAAILKSGITLTDLPGYSDTSAARRAVTDNYRKNLTATFVCAPALRAMTDKEAQDLLSSIDRRNMQLDGMYTSDSLFFVITKIDDLSGYKTYIKTQPDAFQQSIAKDERIILENEEQIEELQTTLEKRGRKQEKNKELVEKMKVSKAKLKLRVDNILNGKSLAGKKRKCVEELTGIQSISRLEIS